MFALASPLETHDSGIFSMEPSISLRLHIVVH